MKDTPRFLIVGAGPAGSSAAMVLARGGMHVTMVDLSRFDKPRVGELLSPEGQEAIKRLLPDDYRHYFRTHIGIVGAWYDAELQRFSHPSWWALDRLGLDRALADRAVEFGAEFHLGTKVQELSRVGDVWRYQINGEEREADWLLIATGRSGQLSRVVGAQVQRYDRQVALVGFLEGAYTSSMDMLIETTSKGWWYGAPIDSERAVAVFITDSDLDKGEPETTWRERLEESIHAKERFGTMQPIQKPSRVAAGFSVLSPSFGEGWVAIGESAAAFDPLSNLGIGRAAETGERLGELFLEAAEIGEPPDLLLYAERNGAEFKTHSGILLDDYRKVHRFPDSVFWARRVAGGVGDAVLRIKSKSTQAKPLIFAEGQNFECNRCGKCCGGPWVAGLELNKRRDFLASSEVQEVAAESGYLPLRVLEDGRLATNIRPSGECVFLTKDSDCSIFDAEVRPNSCSQFPFLLRDTPDGVVVGVSYLCSAVQKNEGQPISAYADQLNDLLAKRTVPVLPRSVTVSWGRGLDWAECIRMEEYLLSEPSISTAIRSLRWYLGRWMVSGGQPSLRLEGGIPDLSLHELEWQMSLYLLANLEHAFFRTSKDMFEDLLENRSIKLWKSRWKGQIHDTLTHYKVDELDWLQAEIERYVRSLVERKFLVLQSPLYHNLLILSAMPQLMRCYVAIYASLRKADKAEPEDLYATLDRMELELTTYGRQDKAAQTFFFWHVAFLRETLVEMPQLK